MKKVYCDVCNKEIDLWKNDFSFPLDKWENRHNHQGLVITDLCMDCHSKINDFILKLKEEK